MALPRTYVPFIIAFITIVSFRPTECCYIASCQTSLNSILDIFDEGNPSTACTVYNDFYKCVTPQLPTCQADIKIFCDFITTTMTGSPFYCVNGTRKAPYGQALMPVEFESEEMPPMPVFKDYPTTTAAPTTTTTATTTTTTTAATTTTTKKVVAPVAQSNAIPSNTVNSNIKPAPSLTVSQNGDVLINTNGGPVAVPNNNLDHNNPMVAPFSGHHGGPYPPSGSIIGDLLLGNRQVQGPNSYAYLDQAQNKRFYSPATSPLSVSYINGNNNLNDFMYGNLNTGSSGSLLKAFKTAALLGRGVNRSPQNRNVVPKNFKYNYFQDQRVPIPQLHFDEPHITKASQNKIRETRFRYPIPLMTHLEMPTTGI